jgi:anti-sigma-K factor RskA
MIDEQPDDSLVLDALARSVPQVAPPAALRARVLEAATAQSQSHGTAIPFTPRPDPVRASSRWPWLVAAAAASIAVTTSIGWSRAVAEVRQLEATVADLRTTAATLLNVRASYDREQQARLRAAAILGAPDVTVTALNGIVPAERARARVYMSQSRGLLMAAEDLPPLPTGRVYQLWTIVAGQPVSAGLFSPDADGRGDVVGAAPGGPVDAFAVTLEPEGGVPAPTGAKVLLGVPAN